jgi:hypothetical protein
MYRYYESGKQGELAYTSALLVTLLTLFVNILSFFTFFNVNIIFGLSKFECYFAIFFFYFLPGYFILKKVYPAESIEIYLIKTERINEARVIAWVYTIVSFILVIFLGLLKNSANI